MRNAYVVFGSEDGVIGVYSNKKAAILHAKDYAGYECEVEEPEQFYNLNKMVWRGWGIVVNGPIATAEIQIWNVEKEFV